MSEQEYGKMPEEEYRIRLDFLKNKISSVAYLMRNYKITHNKALEYMEILSYMAQRWVKNDDGKIVSVFKD